ncbi:MAG: non-ribosomal peptide synthetase, partial [Chloroflexota bacterium]
MSSEPMSHAPGQEPAALSFIEALRAAALREADRPAILAPSRPDLSFTAFLKHVEHTASALAGFGLKPGDCVALVMPNGPELVSAILASMTVCTTVIINPDYKVEECKLFLKNSPAQVLIVPRDWATPAREAAQSLDIRIINLISAPEMPAGLFDLEGAVYAPPVFAQPDDVGVLLPTSGTTGMPKLVPYSHRQLLEDAYISVWRTLSPPPDERKILLNILPLFHLFGFCNLASLAAFRFGIVAASEFNVQDFYAFLEEYHPIGCRALPVMIKTIIDAAPAYQEVIARSSLKMFSSSSAPLMPEMAATVEHIFHAGVATTYGMTEVSTLSWMLTTLKETYKAGSVGKPFRKIVIMDADGQIVPSGEVGEVVVWSKNLFSGYINDPDTQARFAQEDWFHTGDMGYLDAENFLFIIGRFKEIINRGGEKIVPYEIEKVLTGHPAISDAAVFGVPHLSLGEDVAAAIVVTDPALTARQVRQYLAQRLMPQQVPGFIVIVDQIPKTPTSKTQRIGLSKLLGLDNPNERRIGGQGHLGIAPTPPRTEIERQLVQIWGKGLGIPEIGIHDDFFDLGGTSLQAAALVMQVAREFHTTLAVDTMFEAATIAE